VFAGLVVDSIQPGVALLQGGEALRHSPGGGANTVIPLGVGSGVR